MMANLSFYLWFFFNAVLLIHVLHELVLLVFALGKRTKIKTLTEPAMLPRVTIQLPLYNEKYVVKRLLEAVHGLNYPVELLEVQVLDDSTDETSQLVQEFITSLRKPHADFQHIRREDRAGFKAGALDYGLQRASGAFIAIFDADFVPDPQFLLHTLAHFENPEVGLVQARWLHQNGNDSILTMAQRIMLNAHFTIEHLGRSHARGFINFNGTAGVWRRTCILDAGGWQADTLTEDLDLSFRAQIKGWKFKYLFDVGAPAELPVTFDAFRTQQFRWSKGAAECLRKNLGALWKSTASFQAKILGSFHLLNSSLYFLVVGILLCSPAVYYYRMSGAITIPFTNQMGLIGPIVLGALALIFFVGDQMASPKKGQSALLFIPGVFVYFSMTTGISLYMLLGIIEGYMGKASAFVRTPKFGSTKDLLQRVKAGYSFKKEYSLLMFECLALGYGGFWLWQCLYQFNFMTFAYGLTILFGFSLSVFFKHQTFRWRG